MKGADVTGSVAFSSGDDSAMKLLVVIIFLLPREIPSAKTSERPVFKVIHVFKGTAPFKATQPFLCRAVQSFVVVFRFPSSVFARMSLCVFCLHSSVARSSFSFPGKNREVNK